MTIVDLTRRAENTSRTCKAALTEVPLRSEHTSYTGMIYRLDMDSMFGTYIDFPGHIRETDDGTDAANFPVETLYRAKASVIHLDRAGGSGGVSGAELEAAFGGKTHTPVLIVNAIGAHDQTDPAVPIRTVWFDFSALDWMIANKVRVLVSDIYESRALHGVFQVLFKAGITTVCEPANLHLVTARECRLTVLFPPVPGVKQIPCRVIAEF